MLQQRAYAFGIATERVQGLICFELRTNAVVTFCGGYVLSVLQWAPCWRFESLLLDLQLLLI